MGCCWSAPGDVCCLSARMLSSNWLPTCRPGKSAAAGNERGVAGRQNAFCLLSQFSVVFTKKKSFFFLSFPSTWTRTWCCCNQHSLYCSSYLYPVWIAKWLLSLPSILLPSSVVVYFVSRSTRNYPRNATERIYSFFPLHFLPALLFLS